MWEERKGLRGEGERRKRREKKIGERGKGFER